MGKRMNKQHLLKYSGVSFDGVVSKITMDWEGAYPDCKIVTISIVNDGNGLFQALVVFEELDAEKITKPKHGKWFDVGSLSCRCDQCGCKHTHEAEECPHCGAIMDGGKQ